MDHVGQVGSTHDVQCCQQVRCALARLGIEQTGDLGPLEDLGLPLAAEPFGAVLYGDARQRPVTVALLLHRDVEDDGLGAGLHDAHGAVQQLAQDERLGASLLEAPHVDQPGRDDLTRVDAGDACHRYEDAAPPQHLDDQTEHTRRTVVRPNGDHDVADLAHLVTVGVEDEGARESCDEHSGRRHTHAPRVPSRCAPSGQPRHPLVT